MSLLAVVCTFIILSLVVAALILPMLKNDCCPLYDQAVLTVDDLGLDCSIENKLRLIQLYHKWLITEDMEHKYKFNDLYNELKGEEDDI